MVLLLILFWPLLAFALTRVLSKDKHLIGVGLAMFFVAPISALLLFEPTQGLYVAAATSGVVALTILVAKAMRLT